MAVISIISGILLPSITGFQDEAKYTKAQSDLSILKTAVESFRRYNSGALPRNITSSLKSASPRVLNDVLNDPWKTVTEDSSSNGFTYAYVTANISDFGSLYIIYTRGIAGDGSVYWDPALGTDIIAYTLSNAVAISNAPIRVSKNSN